MPIEWHGWSRNAGGLTSAAPEIAKSALHIGPLPGRKGIALYMVTGAVGEPLAYFRSEDAAIAAIKLFDYIMGLEKQP